MNYIKFFENINKDDVPLAGGKGASLGEMTNANIPVPPGFVLLATAFEQFIEETSIKEEIITRLSEINPEDINTIDRAGRILRNVIENTSMPEYLTEEINQAFRNLGAEYVAVRSSATAEDSEIASWAGELDTFLNTTKDDLIENIKKCWASLFTDRAIFYRHEKDLIDTPVSVAVVIQQMIQSEVSGVCFTVHPVTEDYDQLIIEAAYGLGEAIVSGQVTPDSYIVSKSQRMILDINIGNQTKKLEKSLVTTPKADTSQVGSQQSSANHWIDLGEEGGEQKINGKQIIELSEICKNIESHYGFPCDIEWAMVGEAFYITQSRPITTLKKI